MICKLTGNEGPPAKAHIIPESFYLIDKSVKKPLRLVTDKKGAYPQKSWTGVYDETIVTHEGEKIFLKLDDYAFKLLVEQFDTATPVKVNGNIVAYRYEEYDYKKLKLFFLSVLWRAGVSSHMCFERVDLGPHEEIIKNAILNSDPGDSDFYAVVLAVFDDDQAWAKIMDPFYSRFDDIRFYTFYLGNIVAYIKVDKQKARTPLREVQIYPNKPLHLITRKFWGSKESSIMTKIINKIYG